MPLTPAMVRSSQLAEKNARQVRTDARTRSYSDEVVTPEIAITVSAVLAAFTILSEDLSSLPLILYQRRGTSKFRAYDSLYYRLMHDQPNPEHTSMIFRELMVGHLLGWGNFYAQPIFDKKGDAQELWPLRPDKMSVKRFEGERIYIYTDSEGKQRIFLNEEILHIPAFGFDGLIGYSRIALARNAIGLSISTEKYGSKFFSNGANPGIIYRHPGTLTDTAYKHLQESLEEKAGVEKSHEPLIIEEGMDIKHLGLPNDDAQFLETRKFQVSEVARIFRVPPHMIGDVDRSTSWGSGIDAQEQGYVNHTLRPWAVRIEQHLDTRLLPKDQQDSLYYEHLMDALLRGDIQTRYQAYVSAIQNGFMSRNEARIRENMNPRKGLDEMLQPANMVTVTTTKSGGGDPVGGSDQESTDSAGHPLAPLWADAIARIMRREKNDLLGASRRWQMKGQQTEFESWIDQFYGADHVAFIQKQFQPIYDAQSRIYGVNDADHINAYVSQCLQKRQAEVKTMSAAQIADTMDQYIESQSRGLMFAVVVGSMDWLPDGNYESEEIDSYE